MFNKKQQIADLEWDVKILKILKRELTERLESHRRELTERLESHRTLREDFTALLDVLGLEVKHGNSIIEKAEK